jgi:uncharacterized protein (TIGR02145 family)
MTVASEIARIQGVKANILDAIAAKGVTVPSGAKLADCPSLISSISGGGGISADNIVNIIPINKIAVVDANGYIGLDLTNLFNYHNDTYYNYAILSNDDYSTKGLGQVTFYTSANNCIGGRTYRTVIIGGREWLAENLDFKWDGLVIGGDASYDKPRANYYNNDEATYGIAGNKYGILYNAAAVSYLDDNKSTLIPGWHVPTNDDWKALITAVGGSSTAGTKLKSTTGWSSGNGTDDFGFTGVPAGAGRGTSYERLTTMSVYWLSHSSNVYYFDINAKIVDAYSNSDWCYSVRLVKDNQ